MNKNKIKINGGMTAEEALRESEERYRKLFEDDLTGDYLLTPDGKIIICNPAFIEIFKYPSREAAINTSVIPLFPNRQEWATFIDLLRKKKKLEHYECWRRRLDGRMIYVVENVIGRFDEKDELIEIKGYLFDNTDQMKAEKSLRESEERYRKLFEDDLTGDYLITSEGKIIICNPAFIKS